MLFTCSLMPGTCPYFIFMQSDNFLTQDILFLEYGKSLWYYGSMNAVSLTYIKTFPLPEVLPW
mgnify:CR=1 FL=1